MEILVAKSYQGLPVVEEPYVKSGKTYCKVKMKSGSVKEVRTYTQKEYDKMYPAPLPSGSLSERFWALARMDILLSLMVLVLMKNFLNRALLVIIEYGDGIFLPMKLYLCCPMA